MPDLRKFGATSNIIRMVLKNKTTGQGLQGVSSATSGLVISTITDNEATATAYTGANIEAVSTLGTFSAPTSGKVRIKKVDDTNNPGLIELQIADARFAVSSAKKLVISVNDAQATMLDTDYEIEFIGITGAPAISYSDGVKLADAVAHGGTTATLRLGGSTGTPAFYVTNSGGTAAKFESTGGSGDGLHVIGVVNGLNAEGPNTTGGGGIYCHAGFGLYCEATADTGSGIVATCVADDGYGVYIQGNGDEEGVFISAVAAPAVIISNNGDDLIMLNPSGNFHGITIENSNNPAWTGGNAVNIETTGGHGINIAAAGSSKDSIHLTSAAGYGIGVTTTDGHGFQITAGGTNRDGINVVTAAGHGVNLAPVGTSKHGLFVTGGNGGTSDGIKAVAGTGGVAFRQDILQQALTEAYAADGATVTVAQALYEILSFLEERGISGTTMTCKKRDGSTTAMTFTLDSATTPTALTRAT